MTYELNNCYVCGSKMEVDYGGTSECGGYDWQTLYISCTNKNCFVEISFQCDFDYTKGYVADDFVALWNSLTKNKNV